VLGRAGSEQQELGKADSKQLGRADSKQRARSKKRELCIGQPCEVLEGANP